MRKTAYIVSATRSLDKMIYGIARSELRRAGVASYCWTLYAFTFGSSDIKPIPKFNVRVSIWVIITYSPHAHEMATRPSRFAKTQRSGYAQLALKLVHHNVKVHTYMYDGSPTFALNAKVRIYPTRCRLDTRSSTT